MLPLQGAVFEQLDKQNITPVKINVKKEGMKFNISIFKKKMKVKDIELVQFTKQLVTLLKAGVPIASCLDALSEQHDNADFKTVLKQIHDNVEEGVSFSDSLKKHTSVFNNLFINGVKAGEAGGVLD